MLRQTFIAAGMMAAALISIPVAAQDTVVVTGARQDRSSANGYFRSNDPSAIGVTRTADYFVTPLFVSSDSRNPDERIEELFAMLSATMTEADQAGITLVAGRYTLEPVTAGTMRNLPIMGGNRPDTSRVQIYARIPLRGASASVGTTAESIAEFVKTIPATGRSFIDVGTTGLAIDNPEQYRADVVRHIAQESTSYASMFGDDYRVVIDGLDGKLYWQQSSETEIFLYIEHNFTIRPK